MISGFKLLQILLISLTIFSCTPSTPKNHSQHCFDTSCVNASSGLQTLELHRDLEQHKTQFHHTQCQNKDLCNAAKKDSQTKVSGKNKPTQSEILTTESAKHLHKKTVIIHVVGVDWGNGLETEQPYWENAVGRTDGGDVYQVFPVAIFDKQKKIVLFDFNGFYEKFERNWYQEPVPYPSFLHDRIVLSLPFSTQVVKDCPQCTVPSVDDFNKIFDKIHSSLGKTDYQLILHYVGHGGPGVEIFGGVFSNDKAENILAHMMSVRGKKIDLLDFSTNCLKGSVQGIRAYSKYASYLYASPLFVGASGIKKNDPKVDDDYATDIPSHYLEIFSGAVNIPQIIDRYNEFTKAYWANRSKSLATIQQSISLYDLKAAPQFLKKYDDNFGLIQETNRDVLKRLRSIPDQVIGDDLVTLYNNLVIKYIDTREYFKPELEDELSNGLEDWVIEM